MRSLMSFSLVCFLIASALPATAQPISAEDGPIGRSIVREAARFASVQSGNLVDPEWSRASQLSPGTELVVSVSGVRRAQRFFISGDDSGLTVLNLGDPALSAAARDALRELAATHPEHLLAAQRGERFELGKKVRLGPDGVFVAEEKEADLARLVERYERPHVREIAIAPSRSNAFGCAVAGYFGGGVIGGLPGILVGRALGGDTGPALVGMTVGWAIGSVQIYRTCRHKPERAIYSAADVHWP
jgi:hypothetical protein